MSHTSIRYRDDRDLPIDQVLALYRANAWSSAEKPTELHNALRDSHTVLSAWAGDIMVGIGNAISDGHLVVYYPHLLVHPAHQRKGIGKELMRRLIAKYRDFHQHVLFADGQAVEFYQKCGFSPAGDSNRCGYTLATTTDVYSRSAQYDSGQLAYYSCSVTMSVQALVNGRIVQF